MILKGLNRNNELIEIEIKGNIISRVTWLPKEEITGKEHYIIPGFIDIHTHGGYGTDFVDKSEKSIRKYLRNLPQEGTTSIVQATITTDKETLESCLKIAKHVQDNQNKNESRYLGVNIEGNYLNPFKKGAHKKEYLTPLTTSQVDFLTQFNNVRIISHAIELSTLKTTQYMVNKGVIPSIAHTVATGDIVLKHIKNGLKGVTHTFNAMTQFNHREDNAINRALTENKLYTEIIVDGLHVHPANVKLLYKIKPLDKIMIITDSAPPKGMPDGDYKFGELDIYKEGNTIKTKLDDVFAGSIATMHQCFKNMIKFTGCSLKSASIMSSTNQAEYLGIKNLGDIKKGYLADILILDKKLEIVKTIVNGKTLYSRGLKWTK
ncbi:MAG: N-acetylglucosamine-6-phosphate deacetylase [Candidatus Tyloplasma litorale]|nr:MAG: N-acetylglucosamine-6-phosphate deacetylase [Mycoplasmatales bacterium]